VIREPISKRNQKEVCIALKILNMSASYYILHPSCSLDYLLRDNDHSF